MRRSLLTALLFLVVAAPAEGAPFPIKETFRNATMEPGWTLGSSAGLTAPGTDAVGDGWLRLTPAANTQFGYVFNDTAFPSTDGVLAEFDYAVYGGTGADGLTFFLYDGATAAGDFAIGPPGGSLGYSRCGATPGLNEAYVGVGFDTWGNFANTGFCNNGGSGAGLQPNRVVVKGGEAADFPYLGSALTAQPLTALRSQARHVKVSITPDMKLSVYLTYPDGSYQAVLEDFTLPAAPGTLKMGFAASTGGATNVHEIRQALVVKPVDLHTTITDGAAGAPRAGRRTWTATVTNHGPNPTQDATVKGVAGAPGLSDIAWTCAGAGCGAAAGTGVPDTTADLGVGESVTYTISADAAPATDFASMRVTADTAPNGETGDLDPTNNTATDATDLTPVADVLPAHALGAGGTAAQATQGTWRGGNLAYARNWQRCAPDGTACADIPGATATSYAPQPADHGSTIRLRVTATNAAGSTDAFSPAQVLPDAAVVSGPPALATVTTASFSLAATGPAGTTLECALDGAAYAACGEAHALAALADGPHTLLVRAVYGGLVDPTPATHAWTVDTTPPGAPVILAGPGAATTDARARFELAAEPGASLECSLDGAAFAPCAPQAHLGEVALGAHVLLVRQTDAAGRTGPAARHDWTVVAVPAPPGRPTTVDAKLGGQTTVEGDERVRVGCALDSGVLAGCEVAVIADGPGGKPVVVGTGSVRVGGDGASSAVVKVKLNARGRRLLRKRAGGLKVRVRVTARATDGTELTDTTATVLHPHRLTILPAINPFYFDSTEMMTPQARSVLKALGRQLRRAKAITCTGHTDSVGSQAYNERLGRRRASVVCAALRRHGARRARIAVRSAGETAPRTSNATFLGRRANRRVVLRIRF